MSFFNVTFSLILPPNLHVKLLPLNQIKPRKSEHCLNQNQGLIVLNLYFPILCQETLWGGGLSYATETHQKTAACFSPFEYLDCLICPKFKLLLNHCMG